MYVLYMQHTRYVYIALYVRIYFYIYLHYCRSTHETYVCIYLIQKVYMQLGGRCYTSFQLVHYIQVYWIRQFMWLPPPPCGGGLWGLVFFDVAYEYILQIIVCVYMCMIYIHYVRVLQLRDKYSSNIYIYVWIYHTGNIPIIGD